MTAHSAIVQTSKTQNHARWIAHLSAVVILVALELGLNWASIKAAIQVWLVSPTFSHCFLILPISAYLIWAERERLAAVIRPRLYPLAIALLIPVSLMGLVGTLAGINEVAQFAIIASVNLVVLAFLGSEIYRIIWFPLLYLAFLVPSGEYLIGPLQRFTTAFISHGLDLFAIPHYTEGNMIELANGRYAVAEACAGLRFLIATIALGVLFVYLNFRKWRKISIFMLASAIIPVIGNGFRALGIVLLAHFTDNRLATGADHLVYGWGFSVAIMLILFAIGMRYRDHFDADAPEKIASVDARKRTAAFVATLIGVAIVMSAGPTFALWQNRQALATNLTGFGKPPSAPGWIFSNADTVWKPLFATPDAALIFGIAPEAAEAPAVDVRVNYFAGVARARVLVGSSNKLWDENTWHPVSGGNVVENLGGKSVHFAELVIASDREQRLIWWTYWTNDRFTTSPLDVKLSSLRSVFLGNQGSALVTISTPIESSVPEARERLVHALAPVSFLPARLTDTVHIHSPGKS
jgi:exosortase A